MTTANHSTNQPPHGLGNLGQIIEGQEQFKVLTTAEIEALPEAEYLAYCKQSIAMPTTGRTLEEIEASATEILKELNGHNDAGQTSTEAHHHNLNFPWVIVEGTGCDDEQIASEHRSYSDAWKKLHHAYDSDEIEGMPVDIMRRNEDGTLTTEF